MPWRRLGVAQIVDVDFNHQLFVGRNVVIHGEPSPVFVCRQQSQKRLRRLRSAIILRRVLHSRKKQSAFGFHSLKGHRKGEYALTVTANYRLTFRFENSDVLDLNLEDYH